MFWLVALFLLGGFARADSLDQVRRHFAAPPKSARPMVRWWLPGGDITAEEMRREIGVLDDAGFGGGEIQPFRIGLNPKMTAETLARVNDYPTRSFFAKIASALQEARSRGLAIDLTAGSGWPFGGGEAITPELASLELRSVSRTVTGPAHFESKLEIPPPPPGFSAFLAKMLGISTALPPDWEQRMRARTRTIAVLAVRGETPSIERMPGAPPIGLERIVVKQAGRLDPATTVILTDRLEADGSLKWDAPAGEWQIFAFEQSPTREWVIGSVGKGPQLVLDHMNKAAIEAHLKRILGPATEEIGSFYGNGMRALFCDSLEVSADLYWSDNFRAEFKRRRGYDLTPWLPFLKVPGTGDPYGAYDSAPLFDGRGAARVRQDYWRTVSDLWVENFFQPMIDWAHRRRLLARIQAHGAPVDLLRVYGMADIPETEQLYAGGQMTFLKMASSAAHVAGRRFVSSESFVHQGKAFQSTPDSLERDANRLIAAGVNQIFYHGFPYRYLDRPAPGWFPFAPPASFSDDFSPGTKIWASVPRLNAYLSRLQYVAQSAKPVATYASYYPALDYPNRRDVAQPVAWNYDVMNRETLEHSRAKGGKLVTPAGAEYSALVIPQGASLDLPRHLQGVRIVRGAAPADEQPTRWKLGSAEFLFYFNDSDTEKKSALPAASYEIWDAFTGQISPYRDKTLHLAPGKAALLCSH